MKRLILLLGVLVFAYYVRAQNFELVDKQESYQANFGQMVRVSLKIKNNSDKAQFYIIRKVRSDLGESQKGYFCLDNNCLEPAIAEFSKKADPGETINLNYTVETGQQQTQNSFKFEIFPKGAQGEAIEHVVSLAVEEKSQRTLFQNKEITIHDVYPNPVQDQAIIDYKINSDNTKAKIVVHNILGRPLGDYELPPSDTKLKILADEFPAGVYFYTLYIDNNPVLTRKIMVRK
jgi:hypothetical protein